MSSQGGGQGISLDIFINQGDTSLMYPYVPGHGYVVGIPIVACGRFRFGTHHPCGLDMGLSLAPPSTTYMDTSTLYPSPDVGVCL